MIYYHLSEGQLDALERGEDVEIKVGKRIVRTLTSKTPFQVAKEALDAQYSKKLAKIGGEVEDTTTA